MSEISEGGFEVSESTEVNETPPAETGGESSEATQEAVAAEANETGGFEDADNTETPEDNAEDYEETESDDENDESQDVGFNDGDDTIDADSQPDDTDLNEEDNLAPSDENRVGFDDSYDDENDTNSEDNTDTFDKDVDPFNDSVDESTDELLDDSTDYNDNTEESDLDEQEEGETDLGDPEDYSNEDTSEANLDNNETDVDADTDGDPDGGDLDDQDAGDDGEAQSEDPDAQSDNNKVDADADADGNPDGNDADNLDDSPVEDPDGDLDNDSSIDDDLDTDDDFDDEDEDEDPEEIEQYSEDEPEENEDETDSDDEAERDEDNEERVVEKENEEAAEQAEKEAIDEDADNIVQDEANPAEDEKRKVTEKQPETESDDAERDNDGDASTLEPSLEEATDTRETQQDMDEPDPVDDEYDEPDDSEEYRDEGEAEKYEGNENPAANAEPVTQETTTDEAAAEKGAVADEVSKSTESSEDADAYRSAINNMSEYMNAHNYGPDDYAEYSKDPEWQKLNADLQHSMGMDVTPEIPDTATLSPESGKDISASELPDNCVIVNAVDIDMTYAQGMDSDQFWNHHGNTKEDYMRVAEKIPDVQQALDSGKSLDEIKQDPELRDTVRAYYDPDNMIKVEQQPDGSYSSNDDGRHRIAAAQEYGYQIPVEVTNMPENANTLNDGNADVKPGSESQHEAQSPEQPQPEEIEKKAEISETTRESLEAFEQSNWDKLSQVEKEQAVEKLRDSIAEDLQLENKPNIAYYNNENPGDYGGYAASTNTIYINRFNMSDAAETADTIAHESRHCWQHERADNPQSEQDYLFKENFDDYVRPEDDYRAYKNQIVESDARDYAARVTEMIPDKSSAAYSDNETFDKSVPEFDNEFSRSPPEDLGVNSKTLDTSELPADFESKEKAGDYSTKIDDKVEEVEKEPLPDSIAKSFKDGEYRTVVTTEPITLYRVYGGRSTVEGSYCTTEPCVDKDKTRNDLALKSSWGNTIDKEAEIVVPAGTKLNIGRAEEQSDGGKILTGNADQILLPQDWNQDWVNRVRDID